MRGSPLAKLTLTRVTAALLEHSGILLKAAEALGCTRPSLYEFIKKHPELEQVREEARERLLDVGEGYVSLAMHAGDMKTVRWALERLGKNRGYTTRQEMTGADGEPVAYSEIRRTVVDPAAPPSTEPQEEDDDENGDGAG